MNKRYLWVLVLVFLNTSANAQELKVVGHTTRTERSVLSVLQRERCDPKWLSQVLIDSGIDASERNNLPPGRAIRLRALSCKLPAPPLVAQASAPLLARKLAARKKVQETPKVALEPSPRIAPESEELMLRAEVMERAAREKFDQASAALKRVEAREAVLLTRESALNEIGLSQVKLSRNFVRWIITVSILALLLGMITLLLWHRAWVGKRIHYPKVIEYWHEGVKYTYLYAGAWKSDLESDVEVVPRYQCLLCNKSGIAGKQSELRHHASECPAGRVKEIIDPSFTKA